MYPSIEKTPSVAIILNRAARASCSFASKSAMLLFTVAIGALYRAESHQ